jgi:Response regulator containing CheY-like receiver domain and AraC-type DNA-binding domain
MDREEELLLLMKQQEETNRNKVSTNFRQMLEEEFVVSNVIYRFLEYMEQCNSKDKSLDFFDIIKKSEAPIKKISEFDISKHDPSSPMYLHRHTYLELDYVYRGSCKYYINNDEQIFYLKEKQLCIVNQNIVHGIEPLHEDDIIIKCMIPFSYIETTLFSETDPNTILKNFLLYALNENHLNASYLVFELTDTLFMQEILYHLFFEFRNQELGWKQSVKHYLAILFVHLMRLPKENICRAQELEEESLNINKILNCIQKNYPYITLKDLAKDFHFHENYLSRMIKEKTQRSFRDILSQIRLDEAEKLLLDTDLSVTQIAEKVGYRKPTFFYKLFKEHHGVTPMEFREYGLLNHKDRNSM